VFNPGKHKTPRATSNHLPHNAYFIVLPPFKFLNR
jgi:hypothetical protein